MGPMARYLRVVAQSEGDLEYRVPDSSTMDGRISGNGTHDIYMVPTSKGGTTCTTGRPEQRLIEPATGAPGHRRHGNRVPV